MGQSSQNGCAFRNPRFDVPGGCWSDDIEESGGSSVDMGELPDLVAGK